MSHVMAIKTEMRDLAAIRAACKRLGWQFCEGQTTYEWVGRWFDDTPVPRHLFESEAEYKRVCAMTKAQRCAYMPKVLGKCTHAIKVPGATGEIGLIERGNQFIPIWDYYARGLMSFRVENGCGGFAQAYAVEKTKIELRKKGYVPQEIKEKDGRIRVTATAR